MLTPIMVTPTTPAAMRTPHTPNVAAMTMNPAAAMGAYNPHRGNLPSPVAADVCAFVVDTGVVPARLLACRGCFAAVPAYVSRGGAGGTTCAGVGVGFGVVIGNLPKSPDAHIEHQHQGLYMALGWP